MTKFVGTSGTYDYIITFRNAWRAKCEQIIMKARFAMKDDKKTLNEIEFYAKILNIK